MAELRAGHTSAKIATTPKAQGNSSQGTSPPAQLRLTTKVVSAAELDGRLAGVSQIVVPRGAVFTPAARDEIKKYKITISSAVETVATAAGVVLHVAAAATTYNAQAFWQALIADGIRVETTVTAELLAAIEVLASAADQGHAALLVTEQAATALCLANRKRNVRAALGNSRAAVDAAVAEIGANVLVLDPSGRSVFEMKQAVRHWLRHGQPVCPSALATQLN